MATALRQRCCGAECSLGPQILGGIASGVMSRVGKINNVGGSEC